MRTGVVVGLVVFALATTAAPSASAEPPAPAPAPAPVGPCAGKVIGERCAAPDGRSGTCRASTCTRFEHWKSPATTTSYDCVQCLTEGDASAGSTSGNGKLAKNAAGAGCGSSRASTWTPGALAVLAAIGVLARRRGGAER